jgi:hypothetical protein
VQQQQQGQQQHDVEVEGQAACSPGWDHIPQASGAHRAACLRPACSACPHATASPCAHHSPAATAAGSGSGGALSHSVSSTNPLTLSSSSQEGSFAPSPQPAAGRLSPSRFALRALLQSGTALPTVGSSLTAPGPQGAAWQRASAPVGVAGAAGAEPEAQQHSSRSYSCAGSGRGPVIVEEQAEGGEQGSALVVRSSSSSALLLAGGAAAGLWELPGAGQGWHSGRSTGRASLASRLTAQEQDIVQVRRLPGAPLGPAACVRATR